LHKEGGKSDYTIKSGQTITAAVVVCSDTIHQKKGEDKAGLAVIEKLKKFQIEIKHYEVIPDEADAIKQKVEAYTQGGIQLLLFAGGTGVSQRDITADTIKPLLDKELPGIMEQARSYGQSRMPYAMLSGSVAGIIKNSLVLTLPGSTKGATEYIDALFPQVLHVFDVIDGKRHG